MHCTLTYIFIGRGHFANLLFVHKEATHSCHWYGFDGHGQHGFSQWNVLLSLRACGDLLCCLFYDLKMLVIVINYYSHLCGIMLHCGCIICQLGLRPQWFFFLCGFRQDLWCLSSLGSINGYYKHKCSYENKQNTFWPNCRPVAAGT